MKKSQYAGLIGAIAISPLPHNWTANAVFGIVCMCISLAFALWGD